MCETHSPYQADEIAALIAGLVGVYSVEGGRDIVTYQLDHDGLVRAGFLESEAPIAAAMAVKVDAVDPWVHAVHLELSGPQNAMPEHFRMIPPLNDSQTEISIRWGFDAFNAANNL